jgi:hypothetical protein
MSDKKKKKKDKAKTEPKGPFGVGETVEDIKGIDIMKILTQMKDSPFDKLTEKLNKSQKHNVHIESKTLIEKWQTVIDSVVNNLETDEQKAAFKDMILKRAGIE